MPEGKEDDRFDCEELEDRVVRTQELLGGEVKQEECVQSQGYGYVVDHCDIQVTAVRSVNNTKYSINSHLALVYTQCCVTILSYASKIIKAEFCQL